jgi:hypothetical protein
VKPAPPAVDLPAEQRRIRQQSALSFLVCAVALGAAVYWLPQWADFPSEIGSRIAFALRADIFVAVWVLIAVRLVSRIRFVSEEDNAGAAYSPPSPRLAVRAAFLQNTLEQALIAIVANLALATVAGEAPLAFIIASVVLFTVGRLTFLRGYPGGAGARAFGMVTTVLPSLGAFCWVVYDLAVQSLELWR